MQSRFKIQVTNTACGQLQWQQEASERFEFQYPESMWYNVSKEQAASSCLPTRPVQPSVDGVFILCSLEVSVFWFVTVDQDLCRKAFFSLLFVFWCKMSVIVSHTRDCLGISCKWTKRKYEMQSKENDVYMNCIQTVRGQINICGSQNSKCDLHTPVSMIIRFPSSKKEAASVGQEENMESSPAQSQEQTGLSSDYDARRDGEPTWRW